MERKSLPLREKLTVAAAIDFPTASEIVVSFPDQWVLVRTFKRDNMPLYVAGLPPSQEWPRADQFFGLPPEINRSLTSYWQYKLFEPWPQPIFSVAWDETKGEGRVLPGGRLRVQLQPIGQAQSWTGTEYGVLWEAYLSTRRQKDIWQKELVAFWQTVERDMAVNQIFTQPHDPDFEGDYLEFLSRLGYAPDPEFEEWWSKAKAVSN